MEDYEPITTELRRYVGEHTTPDDMMDGAGACIRASLDPDYVGRLCDNIDAVHKRLEALCNRTKDEWIRLPTDADGVPIRVGDMLDGYAKTITVARMRYGSFGWVLISDEGGGFHDSEAFTHHHTPTVEDVLQEFAEKMNANMGMYMSDVIDVDEWHDYDEQVIAEYAAKLRLAGDAE